VLVCLIVAIGTVLTTVDPITVTEYSLVFSAVALPLTYLPILVIANDPDYMGSRVNRRTANVLGTVFLVVIGVASVAAIPLMLATRAGQ
jgi:Mn2+/Fe2+ NRAMP family transporter